MKKLKIIQSHLFTNGLLWTCYFAAHHILKNAAKVICERMKKLETSHKLPGENTISRNYIAWQNWDWSEKGEEWTPSLQWKQSLIDEVLLRYIERGKTVLEIGPGAGRWTAPLQKTAKHLIVVDLSDKCIELCRMRFADCDNIEFFVNNGNNLSFLTDESIDFVWSFDVFVHINAWDTEKYLGEFARILRKEGLAVIHHPKGGQITESEDNGWRSNTTSELFCGMIEKHGLTLVSQFDSWGDHNQFDVKHFNDIITVFRK